MKSLRALLLAMALLVGLTACGSDDDTADGADATETDDGTGQSDSGDPDSGDDSGDDSDDDADDGSDGGSASGTVTMADGTVYELDVSSCETSSTDPAGFPFPNSFDLQGISDDGFEFYIASVGLGEEGDVQTGSLEGGFDENGKNATIIYSATMSTATFTVDGADVTGSVDMRGIGPEGPHGKETSADFDFSC